MKDKTCTPNAATTQHRSFWFLNRLKKVGIRLMMRIFNAIRIKFIPVSDHLNAKFTFVFYVCIY